MTMTTKQKTEKNKAPNKRIKSGKAYEPLVLRGKPKIWKKFTKRCKANKEKVWDVLEPTIENYK